MSGEQEENNNNAQKEDVVGDTATATSVDSTSSEPNHDNTPKEVSPPPKRSNQITMTRSAYHGLLLTAIVGILIGTFFAGYFVASSTVDSFSADGSPYVTQAQLQNLVSGLQQQQQQRPTNAQGPNPAATAPQQIGSVSIDDDPMIGSPNAPVTIVEFSDFQCPFCSKFHQETLPLIINNYVDTGAVNIVYRDFPIDSIHPNARITHIASECADEQKKFWEYHDILFQRQSEWNRLDTSLLVPKVVEYAELLSLDTEEFAACLLNPEINAEVTADKADGLQYGVSGTPAFFVGNDQSGYLPVNGAKSFEFFAQVIDQKLG